MQPDGRLESPWFRNSATPGRTLAGNHSRHRAQLERSGARHPALHRRACRYSQAEARMMQRRPMHFPLMKQLLRLCAGFFFSQAAVAQVALKVETPMSPPAWALMERALLEANSRAVEAFAEKYIDARGYLLHTPRWGTLDGPDDAIETYFNWTLLHALGGSDKVLELYKKGLEG